MTHLNSLIVKGFKSFKNKTELPFQGKGLTAVVGENGSGKSNLVDALTFVMGQRSSKLRAQRLEQLIYNGGENGSRAQQAEVTLRLDNSEGQFNDLLTDFLENGDRPQEISIGRKVTPNSSSYLFMEKNCRRSVIEEVLDRANVDPSSHHIVNQGKITEIVNMRPYERREIVDEMAGISEYEEKKQDAISDLREVKEKLSTNRVVLGERRGQLNRLKQEREAALEYKDKENQLELVKESIIHRKRENKESKLQKFQEKYGKLEEKVDRLQKTMDDLDRESEKKERELKRLREEREEGQNEELAQQVEDLKMELVKKRGSINSKEREVENLQDTVAELKEIKSRKGKSSGKRKSRAVKALLKRDRGGIYGTVEGLMEVDGKHQVAIETAAGGHLHDLVVDSRSTAIESVNYLKKNDLGRARLLPLMSLSKSRRSPSSKKALSLNGVIDYALELVDFDPKFQRAFAYVFRDTIIAENLEAVKSVENVRAVTLDGDVLSRGGAISGGTAKKRRSKGGKDQKASQLAEKIKQRERKIESLKEEIQCERAEVKQLARELEKKEKAADQRTEVNQELKEKIQGAERRLNQLKNRKREKYRELEKSRSRKHETEKKLEGLKYELDNLEEADPSRDFIDEPLKDLVDRRRTLQRELDRLQPVNMKSIEEYDEFKAQVQELNEKLQLLRDEKREVERLIGHIEEMKKEQFYDTLTALSQNFGEIFEELFDGGNAWLELEREDDIESGLLIKAHPPGKELHVLDSLSGGEKSLTAIAFIFALQELNPSPFYIMDEIDAALDQRRSKKLAELLDRYAQKSQLILISHNEETAKHADRVYGVSMKDSRSKVLSLQLN
ncbi:MAG: chromosome segregation SMC family protein [Candidatus Acetothermia bacterium]